MKPSRRVGSPQSASRDASTHSATPTTRSRRLFAAVGILGLVAAALWASGVFKPSQPVATNRPTEDRNATPANFPLPAITPSPFRNTGPHAKYVGSETCASCHEDRNASFRRTGMGQSMAAINIEREPKDGVFDHPLSKRRYHIERKDGRLWHREKTLADNSPEQVIAEYPLTYVVGSGRHARTYLAEAEGFLVESPITWYRSRAAWDMSPGYDLAAHQGFGRAVGESCLYCHAGRAEAVGKTQHQMTIVEAAIGCERCHGPGSLHVELHTSGQAKGAPGAIDHTIVNPRRLPRELAEAVCYQCHFLAPSMVPVRGRKISDYRPGLHLEDFRTDYYLDGPNRGMTVTGHVEQMHQSLCYTKSETLTCTTCHNPHAFPKADDRPAYYRKICQECHAPNVCGVTKEQLQKESPDNDCAKCHMPSAPTDVPHVSFTHHRIGIHGKEAHPKHEPGKTAQAATLRPWREYPGLTELDRQRSLGLGYLELAREQTLPALSATYQTRAFELMTAAYSGGLREPFLESKLARIHFEMGSRQALGLAKGALAHPEIAGSDRCAALFVLGGEQLRAGRFQEALGPFRELGTLRRHPHDWLLTAECEKALGNIAAANDAVKRAAQIQPQVKPSP